LAEANDANVGMDLEEQPARLDQERFQLGDAHRRAGRDFGLAADLFFRHGDRLEKRAQAEAGEAGAEGGAAGGGVAGGGGGGGGGGERAGCGVGGGHGAGPPWWGWWAVLLCGSAGGNARTNPPGPIPDRGNKKTPTGAACGRCGSPIADGSVLLVELGNAVDR